MYLHENQTVHGLTHVSLSLIIFSFIMEKFFQKNTNFFIYFVLFFAILLFISGIYKLLTFKEPITFNKKQGIINLIIGICFSISIFARWYEGKMSIIPVAIGIIGSTIFLALGILILKKGK